MMKQLLKALSSPIFMTFLLVLLIVTMAAATFIENDYGSMVARYKVYDTWWFELALVLLAINLMVRIFMLKLYKPARFSIFLFHIAFVFMLIGAGITRYFGQEGTMHIRESQSSNLVNTYENEVKVRVYNHEGDTANYTFDSNVELRQVLNETFRFKQQKVELWLEKYYHTAQPVVSESNNGKGVVSFIVSGNNMRGMWHLSEGESKLFNQISIAFNASANVQIISDNDSLFLLSDEPVQSSLMGEEAVENKAGERIHLETSKLYQTHGFNLVFQNYYPNARIEAAPVGNASQSAATKAMVFGIRTENHQNSITLWEDSWNNTPVKQSLGDLTLDISYGKKTIELPFSIHLNNFVIDRYPGSLSPSSYSSHVSILEKEHEPRPYHIYMNHILKHKGYRFFQSSYDNDEQGTILSVNHDPAGTAVTYFAYFLMALGMVWSLINRQSFFRKTSVSLKTIAILALIFSTITPTTSWAQASQPTESYILIDKQHADKFGELLIQNSRGRTEPVHSFASDLMRKIARKNSLNGISPTQLFIEMNRRPDYWSQQKIIRVSNGELKQTLGLTGNYASYSDFFSQNRYVLQELVQMAHAKPLASQSKYDKAIIKTDEKINICYGIFTGDYLKIFPAPGHRDSTVWHQAEQAAQRTSSKKDSLYLSAIIPTYYSEIRSAKQSSDYTTADQYLEEIIRFQQENAGYELPSHRKIKIEIGYNKYNPFKLLFPYYLTLGLLYLILLLVMISTGRKIHRVIHFSFYFAILAGFTIHTAGYITRWYLSGHAPMSNGYETMVFISWITILAGFIFNKKSAFTLSATAILGGLTLMVANLSFMDPQITNLVPVLQSYWLTIHVSVITAGYGFLGLGAILGLINLVLTLLQTAKNRENILNTYRELTIINHKTLIAGLYLLTIGTFLGAVWANESWGRYWGWDPKETWALISIIVYTLVTHARMIPGMRGYFVFNALSLWGFSSIIMTYFGVNYYLSGLHSYAGGDPVPVPSFVYYTIAALIILTVLAAIKKDSQINHPTGTL